MSYTGQQAEVPLGLGGILTDVAPNRVPIQNLILATNVLIEDGVISKDEGSKKWNTTALPSGVVGAFDWWPNEGTQYLIAVTREGRVYRFIDQYTFDEVLPTGTAPALLSVKERVHFVEGGQEAVNSPKKLFIFTGQSQVQVITGTNLTRSDISGPSADWGGTGFYPFFGIIAINRLFVFGNTNKPHFVYASSDTDQENFTMPFNTALFNVFPGEGQRLQTAVNYKGRLHLLKYPSGLYALNLQDVGDPTSWFFEKLNADFGTASIHGVCPVLDDFWMTTGDGSIASAAAAFKLGQLDAANVLRDMKVSNYVDQITTPLGIGQRQSFWNSRLKRAMFIYRKPTSTLNSLILNFDLTGDSPRFSINDKDQPNCLFLRKSSVLTDQMYYGSEDGYIYQMEQADRNVGDEAYTGTFQTPHLNFGIPNDKLFQFLEIEYIPTGAFNLTCDVYIDGNKTQTKSFYLGKSNQLNVSRLDNMRLQGRATRKQRLQIHGRGRTISAKFYMGGLNRNFKVCGLTVYFQTGGQDEKGKDNRNV